MLGCITGVGQTPKDRSGVDMLCYSWLLGSSWWRSEAHQAESACVVGTFPRDGDTMIPSANHSDFCIAVAFSSPVKVLITPHEHHTISEWDCVECRVFPQGVQGGVRTTSTWLEDSPDTVPLEWRAASPLGHSTDCSTVWIGSLPAQQKVTLLPTAACVGLV